MTKTKSNLCDDLKYSTLIDRSLRPVGRLLNVKSKGDFINYMLVEELADKRLQLLQNFRGLKLLWPLEVDDKKPPSMETIVCSRKPSTVNAIYVFMDLVQPPTSPDELQAKAYGLFVTFVMGYTDCTGKVHVMVTYDTRVL